MTLSSINALTLNPISSIRLNLFPWVWHISQPLDLSFSSLSCLISYKYFHGRCSSELSELILPLKTFFRNTRLSSKSNPLIFYFPNVTGNSIRKALFLAILLHGIPYHLLPFLTFSIFSYLRGLMISMENCVCELNNREIVLVNCISRNLY